MRKSTKMPEYDVIVRIIAPDLNRAVSIVSDAMAEEYDTDEPHLEIWGFEWDYEMPFAAPHAEGDE